MSVPFRFRRAFWLSVAFFVGFIVQTTPIAHAQTPQSCPLAMGKAYRSPAAATVYLVTQECTKRPFFNPAVYLSFFADWNQVTFVEQSSLDKVPNDALNFLPWGPRRDFQTGSLVKITSDPTVYLISGGQAYPIVSEQAFTSLGLSFQEIEDVAAATLAKYPIQSSSIQSPADIPPTTVFKYANSPDVYILQEQNGQLVKAHVETMNALIIIARPDRIVVLPPDLIFNDTTNVTEQTAPLFAPAKQGASTSTDSIAPTVTSFTIPTFSTSRTIPVYSFTATDTVGVTGYRITETGIRPSATSTGWSSVATSSYGFLTATGTRTLYAWAKDAAGNVSTYRSASVTFATSTTATSTSDTTAPTVTSFMIPLTATSRVIPVTSFTATDNIGVTGYLITDGTSIPSPTANNWSSNATTSYSFASMPSAGTRTLYAWAKDAAGNISRYVGASVSFVTSTTATSTADTTAPTVTSFTIPFTATSRVVSVTSFTATDNVGVTGYKLTETGTSPSATTGGWETSATSSYTFATSTGLKVLYAWAKDAAGNVSTPRSATTTLEGDIIKPTVMTFAIPASSISRTIPVTSFTATDNVSVKGYLVTETATTPSITATGWLSVATSSYAFSTTGAKTLFAWAKDAAGNVSASLSATVLIATSTTATSTSDTTKPVVTSFTIPSTATSRVVSITSFTATDTIGVTGYMVTESSVAPSGSVSWPSVATTSYTFATSTGLKTLYAWAKDAAGNVSASRSASTTLLSLPPVIFSISATPSATTATSMIIAWTTDQPSTTIVEFGSTASYEQTLASGSLTTSHALTLANLSSSSTYHYRVSSRNAAGVTATSSDMTFQMNDLQVRNMWLMAYDFFAHVFG